MLAAMVLEPNPATPADELRAADADREAAADRLRRAAGEGRIDLSELDERLERVYRARTYGELRTVTSDLPSAELDVAPSSHQVALREPETLELKTTAPNLKQAGPWVVPRTIVAETKSGIITIDFTRATCAHEQVVIEATTGSGWIRVILPEGWAAKVGPASTNTAHISNKAADTPAPGSPTVIVNGHPGIGLIKIRQRRGR